MKIVYTNYGKSLKDYSIEINLRGYSLGIGFGNVYKLYNNGNIIKILGGK